MNVRAVVMVTVIGALRVPVASAFDGPRPEPTVREMFRASMPRGWRLEDTPGDPSAVTAVGPSTSRGRAVVLFRPWRRRDLATARAADRVSLAKALTKSEGFTAISLSPRRGPLLRGATVEGRRARHLLSERGIVTVVAPERALAPALRWAQKAVLRLPPRSD